MNKCQLRECLGAGWKGILGRGKNTCKDSESYVENSVLRKA